VPKATVVVTAPRPQVAVVQVPVPQRVTEKTIGATIGQFIHQLRVEMQQTLVEEGLDDLDIYAFDKPVEPSIPPKPLSIDPRIAQAFRAASGIENFYSHQVEARQALLAGKNVIISTPTASGKTEAYNPTILEALLTNPNATALYLFPLVALGFDQTNRLEKLNSTLPQADRLTIGIYNKNVSQARKDDALNNENRILVTTPDSLHYICLGKPKPHWERFYRNLRYVVVDEAHIYKGVFGANMANILRRLLIRCRREGNPRFPQLIISSATVRHPSQLAHQLSGLPADDFVVIDRSGAPGIGRHSLAIRSDSIPDVETLCVDLLDVVTTDGRSGETRPVRTIVFLRSIKAVKQAVDRVRQQLHRAKREERLGQVESYYSDKADKLDILERLRKGEVLCLFTTTALMAGIDIGGLDVSIVRDFPGLVMDARQMFGRAGRTGEGAAIYIARRTDVIDQFYFEHPEQLFKGPTEEVIANPENPFLLAAHLKCAAQINKSWENYQNKEGPLPGSFVGLFGSMGQDLLNSLTKAGTLNIQDGAYYLNRGNAHKEEPLNNLRSMASETYKLIDVEQDRKLEDKRQSTAFRDAHPEALVRVNGENYRVIEFNRNALEIKCRPESATHLRTQGVEQRTIAILAPDMPSNIIPVAHLNGGVTVHSGKISITTSVPTYKIYQIQKVMQCRKRTCRQESPNLDIIRCVKCGSPVRIKEIEKIQEERPVPITPPLSSTLETRACWLDISSATKQQYEREFWPRWVDDGEDDSDMPAVIAPAFEFAVHSVEHALLKAFPDQLNCDRDEVGGIYEVDAGSQSTRLFIYDNFPGGLGLADEFAADPQLILRGALDVIERCTCGDDEGCPVCLPHFGCHTFNQMLSKLSGRYLLRLMLGADPSAVISDLKEYTHIYKPNKTVSQSPREDIPAPSSADFFSSKEEEDQWWMNLEVPTNRERVFDIDDNPY
jgi:DEAD/DEAH box helicase domain-containing protein